MLGIVAFVVKTTIVNKNTKQETKYIDIELQFLNILPSFISINLFDSSSRKELHYPNCKVQHHSRPWFIDSFVANIISIHIAPLHVNHKCSVDS